VPRLAEPPPPPPPSSPPGPWGGRRERAPSPSPPPAPPRPTPGSPLETHRFPCPNCGADLRYTPGPDLLTCQHCGAQEPIPERRGAVTALDLSEAARLPEAAMEETRVVGCDSCGAQIEFDPDIHAQECPFCASPMVTDTGLHRHIKPQGQLPFLIDEAQARDAFRRWIARLWFAPGDLRALARTEGGLQGLYVPYWTFDADAEADYVGQRGTVRHRSQRVAVTVGGKREMQTRTVQDVSWTPVRGRVARRFRDVPTPASRSLPPRLADGIGGWDFAALSAYEPRYLAGFRAEGYTVPAEEGLAEARALMEDALRADARRQIGGDQQRVDRLDARFDRVGFKHVLLPMWLAAYRYGGKSYRFAVNGRTGAVRGDRPWSVGKIALAIVAAIVLALIFAVLAG
jgi:predicted RNA-binding Zn-ribbon protein involved in translation (DUF1610 family)